MGNPRSVASKFEEVRDLTHHPVAFIGAISNIHSLCFTYHWLAWICKAPSIVVNLIQGFLPTVLLALLFMLVPIVMRIFARLEGIPQKTGVELSLMDRFFIFQVIVCGHGTSLLSDNLLNIDRTAFWLSPSRLESSRLYPDLLTTRHQSQHCLPRIYLKPLRSF